MKLVVDIDLNYNQYKVGMVDEFDYNRQITKELKEKLKKELSDVLSGYFTDDLLTGFNVEIEVK